MTIDGAWWRERGFRDRGGAAVCTAVVVALLGWALVRGLAMGAPVISDEAISSFTVAPLPPPPPRIVPLPKRNQRAAGEAAPPNLRSSATPVVAPVPVVPLPVPPPIVVAPDPGIGLQASQGAAERPGPGTGAGGQGRGTGSGGDGDGDGGGWDETPPRRVKGRIRDSDYPRGAGDAGVSGTVSVRYFVEVNGRATGCIVTGSSGSAELDTTTCRLIEQRFRYDPSRDARGRPVRSVVVVDHEWVVQDDPPEPRR